MARRRDRALIALGGAALLGGVAWRVFGVRHRVEEPAFRVLGHEDGVELREYEPYVVAVTEVAGDYRGSLDQGFRRLAGFIFGGNTGSASIEMTAPVSLQRAEQPAAGGGERIAMTAPVSITRGAAATWRITFAMPSRYTMETLPRPIDPHVHLEPAPGGKVAALRFTGLAAEPTVERKRAELLERLQRLGRRPLGEPTLARYDPPWTPPFMRRNEILVPVE